MIDLEASPRVLTRRRIGRDKSHVTRQQDDSSVPRAEPAPNHRLRLAVTEGQPALSPEYEQQAESSAVAALLQRIASGDEAAMRALHLRYDPRVFAFVSNRLRDSAEAEEVVADTMFEVWKHPLRFRGESRFSTWLLGVARHKLLNTLRARTRARRDQREHRPIAGACAGWLRCARYKSKGLNECSTACDGSRPSSASAFIWRCSNR